MQMYLFYIIICTRVGGIHTDVPFHAPFSNLTKFFINNPPIHKGAVDIKFISKISEELI